jgi:hypothetical protein
MLHDTGVRFPLKCLQTLLIWGSVPVRFPFGSRQLPRGSVPSAPFKGEAEQGTESPPVARLCGLDLFALVCAYACVRAGVRDRYACMEVI